MYILVSVRAMNCENVSFFFTNAIKLLQLKTTYFRPHKPLHCEKIQPPFHSAFNFQHSSPNFLQP